MKKEHSKVDQPIMLFLSFLIVCSSIPFMAYPLENMPEFVNTGQQTNIKGLIVEAKDGTPLEGVTVQIKNTTVGTLTDEKGEFLLSTSIVEGVLQVSLLGYQKQEFAFTNNTGSIDISLERDAGMLEEVVINTGYQEIPKERATGSFVHIDNKLLNRRVSTNILERLDGVASGLIFNTHGNRQFHQSDIEVRGRSTLFGNANPLIILDNFPYDGDIKNINPNDIESITVLKDAAAASAWGARSGNGVIVITTKKGSINTAPQVSFNSNLTIGQKPDLFYRPQLSSEQNIEVQQFLFNNGAYKSRFNNEYTDVPQAVEIFYNTREGLISPSDSLRLINQLKGYDSREDISKYYLRQSINQQYQASISGGAENQKYFVSMGYDKNQSNNVGNSNERVTLNATNTYYLLNKRLEFVSGILFSTGKSESIPNFSALYPYDKLADQNGNALTLNRHLRSGYIDTVGNGKLLDWNYRPLDELKNEFRKNETQFTDYRINLSLSYKILNSLKALFLYNYQKGNREGLTNNEVESFYTRDLINRFSQINPVTGTVIYPIPIGDIMYSSTNDIKSQQGRFQLSYHNQWKKHEVNAISGTEIKDFNGFTKSMAYYGYDPETASNQNSSIDYTELFPYLYGYGTARIPDNISQRGNVDRFFSIYTNASYVYDKRYILSISARKDESNLFGVKTNQKGVPLWSAGFAWNLDFEDFYNLSWLPFLKLRTTFGYTGNVDNSLSAYLTSRIGGLAQTYQAPYAEIVNPPNPSLRWEKIKNINLGIDFGLKNNRINGSIDYWIKEGIDLIGNSPIAPQTGINRFTGNSANTKGKGLDVLLNSKNITVGGFFWTSNLLYNFYKEKVTDYKVDNGSNYDVVSSNYNNPLEGFPYYSVFSFKYAGLDHEGNPNGYLGEKVTQEYTDIMNAVDRQELVFHGSARPVSFGSLRNNFQYKSFGLSFNITYKLGYFYRRTSLNNSSIYSTGGNGYLQADYENRWQKPGDENLTNVPSLIYPSNNNRNALYAYSEVLVERADHIRFQDLRIGYTLQGNNRLPFQRLNIFAYVNNLGILYRANKQDQDPDYPDGIPAVRTIAFGLNFEL